MKLFYCPVCGERDEKQGWTGYSTKASANIENDEVVLRCGGHHGWDEERPIVEVRELDKCPHSWVYHEPCSCKIPDSRYCRVCGLKQRAVVSYVDEEEVCE